MTWSWLPEIARSEPRRPLRMRYRAVTAPRPLVAMPAGLRDIVDAALFASGMRWRQTAPVTWEIRLPWNTLVLAVVRREVEERLILRLVETPDGPELELVVLPVATHAAHAAGFAGVLVAAALAWIAGGLVWGIPVGLTTAVAGGLWADATREMALTALARRLHRLLDDVGQALWPGAVAGVRRL